MIKKIVNVVIVVVVLSVICLLSYVSGQNANAKAEVNYYPSLLAVQEIDNENSWIYAKDANGNLWAFEGDNEDWQIGDYVAVIFNDFGTSENVYDDEIVQIKYAGYAELFE